MRNHVKVDPTQINNAAEVICQGGVIAYPTESTFGLGCAPDNLEALKKILKIKQRPAEKGLIILVSDIQQAGKYIQPLTKDQLNQISEPRERATTWLIPREQNLPIELCGTHPKIAVRITQHPIAYAICEAIGMPLVSTSCNLSGEPAMTDACAIKVQMGNQLDLVVSGEVGGQDASQIIDIETGQMLRS
ncbi:MAG: L-threonylcarbamoyladenylate synthase [Kangiellaceae bacterium]|nr:L-threonylcarbamoyladenylate synthase [Kangiellaceae bacterium]